MAVSSGLVRYGRREWRNKELGTEGQRAAFLGR